MSNTYHFWNNGGSALSFGEIVNVCLQTVWLLCRLLGSCREGVGLVLNRLGCGLWVVSRCLPFFSQALGGWGGGTRDILSFPLFLCLFSSKDSLAFKLTELATKFYFYPFPFWVLILISPCRLVSNTILFSEGRHDKVTFVNTREAYFLKVNLGSFVTPVYSTPWSCLQWVGQLLLSW